ECDQVLDVAFAESVDVHRTPRCEMRNGLRALRGAHQSARATRHHLAFFADDRRTAYRAMLGHVPRLGAWRPALQIDPHDFRNHVAGAAHDHGVADAHV